MGESPFAVLREGEDEGGGGGTPPADPPNDPPADPPAAPDYSWMPEAFRPEGADPDTQGFLNSYNDAQAQLAALAEGRPETADGYKITVPENIDYGENAPPEWFNFEIDAENPLVGELQNWMHQHAIPAAATEGLVTLLAKLEAGKATQFQATADQEMQALGPQGQARIDRVTRSLQTRIADKGQRDALIGSLTSADAYRALETLLSASPGTRSVPKTPRPGAVDPNASPRERLIAAREAS